MSNLDYYDLLGKPFRLGGRGPDFYDCWGLCMELGRRVGIILPEDFTPEKTEDQDRAIRQHIDKDFTKLEKPEPYAIVAFSITPGLIDHCGFILEDRKHFVHTMHDHHVVVLRLDHRVLLKKREGFYRYHG